MGEIPEPEAAKVVRPEPSSWLSLRVFYLRVSKCEVNDSMLDSLTVTYIPFIPDTVVEVRGDRPAASTTNDDGHVSCSLHRDRVDKASQEATFVSTETVRMTGSVRFQVHSSKGGDKLLVGIMEMCDMVVEGSGGEAKTKGWVMKCQVATQRGPGFLIKGGDRVRSSPPTIEVYVASLFQGAPIVFNKAMLLRLRRKRQVKAFMEPIPECGEQAEDTAPQKHDPEESEYYRCYRPDFAGADDEDAFYMRPVGPEGEGSELSWFTAGFRVGVGISLGICLGVGIGAGLLASSYQSTSRSLKRRLISSLL